jgi:hypothetical protein
LFFFGSAEWIPVFFNLYDKSRPENQTKRGENSFRTQHVAPTHTAPTSPTKGPAVPYCAGPAVETSRLNGRAADEGARRHALRRSRAIDQGRPVFVGFGQGCAWRNAAVAFGIGGGARSCRGGSGDVAPAQHDEHHAPADQLEYHAADEVHNYFPAKHSGGRPTSSVGAGAPRARRQPRVHGWRKHTCQ